MGLGVAEYRNGHYPAANEALDAAARTALEGDRPRIQGTSGFYRAMSLFRQGQETEARQLFTETEAKMKPLPPAEGWPLTEGADHDDLILWLAYKVHYVKVWRYKKIPCHAAILHGDGRRICRPGEVAAPAGEAPT
jgi:hypothetical protein